MSGGTLPGTWAKRNLSCLDLLFDPIKIRKLLSVKPDAWTTVAAELSTECKSNLGHFLFADKLDTVATQRADDKALEDVTSMLRDVPLISQEVVEKHIDETTAAVAGMPGSAEIPDRRKAMQAAEVYSVTAPLGCVGGCVLWLVLGWFSGWVVVR